MAFALVPPSPWNSQPPGVCTAGSFSPCRSQLNVTSSENSSPGPSKIPQSWPSHQLGYSFKEFVTIWNEHGHLSVYLLIIRLPRPWYTHDQARTRSTLFKSQVHSRCSINIWEEKKGRRWEGGRQGKGDLCGLHKLTSIPWRQIRKGQLANPQPAYQEAGPTPLPTPPQWVLFVPWHESGHCNFLFYWPAGLGGDGSTWLVIWLVSLTHSLVKVYACS